MQLIDTRIREEGGSNPALRVDFSGDGGEMISVLMRQTSDLSRENAVEKARDLMIELGRVDEKDDHGTTGTDRGRGDLDP